MGATMSSVREWLKKLFSDDISPAREYDVRVYMDELDGPKVRLVLIDGRGFRYAVNAVLLPDEGHSSGYPATGVLIDAPPRDGK